ncbi:hypothetical protein C7999DRAFT_11448 [Corynascus novoguineensis]|uniref:Secondary alcohol dehydrogenase n=1 Tax=Corynascus novoguineensis TaxID=1126955 RepID=A0AAN7HTL6_9PEZI|nr:hypothetical protein C7999DRAFT_11448 [Corynascus novoguineensis]
MSAESLPITPARFAAALKDLPLSSLHLKVLELRNSIAHLDYSNEQLRPFAEGTTTTHTTTATTTTTDSTEESASPTTGTGEPEARVGVPDQDCLDAIRENEVVIERMQERIRLVRAEVESRGLSWAEFQGADETRDAAANDADSPKVEGTRLEGAEREEGASRLVNGVGAGFNGTAAAASTPVTATATNGEGRSHSAWTDGTFQTGVIRDGVVHMNPDPARQPHAQQGGSLTDEELRRRVEEQMRGLGGDSEDDEEGGLHL